MKEGFYYSYIEFSQFCIELHQKNFSNTLILLFEKLDSGALRRLRNLLGVPYDCSLSGYSV